MSLSPLNPADPVTDPTSPDTDEADDATPASPSRRQFVRKVGLGAAALGAAAATGVALTDVASAQTATATTPDLQAADVALVQFLQSISLAAEEGLSAAGDIPRIDTAVAEQFRLFSRHHRDHATAFGALLPKDDVVANPNPTLTAQLGDQVDGAATQGALLAVIFEFEEKLAATMLAAMGEAESFVVAGTVASVLPIVGQQAAATGSTSGTPIADWMPVVGTTDGALTPAAFPVN